ncbi:hypothetical protein [Rhodopila sp.]|uniref:hypothetical protein n=1 Tax=Rhodopila sp. TaxID=2480087 RepID=UPI003D0B5FA6
MSGSYSQYWGATPVDPVQAFNTSGALILRNITVPTVIKPVPGHIARVTVITQGSPGSFIFNDCARLADASLGNQMLKITATMAAAMPNQSMDLYFSVGIVLSGVPGGGAIEVAFNAWR